MKVQTKCKFCFRGIEMEVDQIGFENPTVHADLWFKHIACTRCANYLEAKRKIAESIGRACNLVLNCRGDGKVLGVVREKLVVHTKALCDLVCSHNLLQFFWEEEFVNLLMERPERFSKIINTYTSNIKRFQPPQVG